MSKVEEIPVAVQVQPTNHIQVSQQPVDNQADEDYLTRGLRIFQQYYKKEISFDQLLSSFELPSDSSDPFYIKLVGHGIHPRYWGLVNVMRMFDFAFIIDNSGSMTMSINN